MAMTCPLFGRGSIAAARPSHQQNRNGSLARSFTVAPAKAGAQGYRTALAWIPAGAGMTTRNDVDRRDKPGDDDGADARRGRDALSVRAGDAF